MDGRLLVTAKSIEFEIKAEKGFGHWQKTIQAEKENNRTIHEQVQGSFDPK